MVDADEDGDGNPGDGTADDGETPAAGRTGSQEADTAAEAAPTSAATAPSANGKAAPGTSAGPSPEDGSSLETPRD